MKDRILQTYDGEWVDVTVRSKVECCGCGFVHKENYTIVDGDDGRHILRQSTVDRRATGNARRSMKARKEGVFAKKRKK